MLKRANLLRVPDKSPLERGGREADGVCYHSPGTTNATMTAQIKSEILKEGCFETPGTIPISYPRMSRNVFDSLFITTGTNAKIA